MSLVTHTGIKSIVRVLVQSFCVLILLFVISRSLLGDIVQKSLLVRGIEPTASTYNDAYAREKKRLGLDLPVFYLNVKSGKILNLTLPIVTYTGLDNQFHRYITKAFILDFGTSMMDGKPVLPKIGSALTWSFITMILAFVMSYFLAIWLGRFWVGTTKWSNFVEILLLIIYTIPLFWLAILMVTYFSNPLYGFHWFSLASYDIAPSLWQKVVRVLPMVVCITIAELSYYLSLYRRNLRYESSKPYVNALVAKGLDSKNILLTHLGPNAMSPVVAALAISIPSAFSSLLLLENIFNVAGIGRLMWQAYEMSDWPVLFGTVFVISFICAIAFEIATTIQAYYQPKLDVHAQH